MGPVLRNHGECLVEMILAAHTLRTSTLLCYTFIPGKELNTCLLDQ